ncbi:MAG: cell wall-binding repeat-containing protein [Clostridium tyrobutyricum]|uniref:cell wall-binding repeat-containing protein n=1 Tax=Clostridium tyrobutyricum TaxID=1519 RepID=UPI00242CC4DE|nr:cell wall-binding repeat-containing protein [Clostridium tyrobutyricum]MCH4199695.1 cell wall-binding repeat-containing protein [Clostridium tyrobutyricum]MCH4236445.1 cell wall-binding repeat-containing protein [Clostridium tyrobutyricum]MCH4258234.1 cell wall-binding repeat-containing protein [Clostridium tyrobutyricum]MCI1239403.1 cell wall-binding repeat-containing protein [Clostridium tyrobutyricum]MCI1653116.1 cell wall-binding repeat-containing protein [Clostridium tyrobutyricum]
MKKTVIKTIGSAAVLTLAISTAAPAGFASAAGEVTTIGGTDSYETAASAATSNWTSPDNVVLVSGEGYADAISSVVLSKKLNAPILLTGSSSLNSSAKDALDKLKPKNIYIVGGTGVISQSIRNQLKSENYNLIELSGKNRYETNAAVANQLVKLGMDPSNVMMTAGSNFSDALSAAPTAAVKDEILLLGDNNTKSMSSVVDFIKSSSSKVTVVGTSNVINDVAYKAVGGVNRIDGGSDRFATNLNILKAFDSSLKSDKIYVANASGTRYADSLISASLAGINSSPLVLVNGEGDTQTTNALNYIKSKASSSTQLNVISEKGVISDKTVSDIKNAANGIVGESATINSVTAVGLNQIKVVFNTAVDKSSAERVANYAIDGNSLGSETQTQSSAYLQDDDRTVLITFQNPFSQGKNVDFTVKSNVFTDGTAASITKYEKEVTFQETGSPSIESVTPIGGNKLKVKFTEPVRMSKSDLSSMKINKRSVRNYGLDTSNSELKDQCGDWADGVDLYFDSILPIGDNTFTMPDGTSGSKFDNGANIPIQSQSKSFTVESVSGKPQVESVTTNNAGTIYIKYNRAMDQETALEPGNYKINGDTVNVDSSYVTFDSGSGDSVVKIKNVGSMLNQGTNTILVKNNIEDTFQNSISQTSMSLYYGSSSQKPSVTSASVLDDNTIRVKFNKDVVRSYATNKGNYTITDSEGNNISYKLDSINTITVDGNNNRTFDLKFDDNTLNGSKYNLTVKNIIDTEAKANVMDDYTTSVSGMDTSGLSVTEIVKRADNDHAVTMFFSKTMDDDSISNKSNYVFRDGTGQVKSLPGGATVTSSYDDKSVTIEFSSNYTIGSGSSSTSVIQLGVKDVVDQDGNSLDLGSYIGDISTDYSSDGPGLISGTSQMTFSGDDIKVKVSLTGSLDILDMNDFRVDGYTPDSISSSGNDVVLTYKSGVKNGEKINAIKNCGESTNVSIVNSNSVDSAGRSIRTGSTIIYIPPTTKSDQFTAVSSSNNDTVNVVFNQSLDKDIQNQYSDDFEFKDTTTGKTLSPTSVSVDGKNVVYKFSSSSFDKGDTIKISANSSSINIRSEKHGNYGYTTYSPSSDDLDGYTVTAK